MIKRVHTYWKKESQYCRNGMSFLTEKFWLHQSWRDSLQKSRKTCLQEQKKSNELGQTKTLSLFSFFFDWKLIYLSHRYFIHSISEKKCCHQMTLHCHLRTAYILKLPLQALFDAKHSLAKYPERDLMPELYQWGQELSVNFPELYRRLDFTFYLSLDWVLKHKFYEGQGNSLWSSRNLKI